MITRATITTPSTTTTAKTTTSATGRKLSSNINPKKCNGRMLLAFLKRKRPTGLTIRPKRR
jgi:hypothetical protein